VGLEGLDQLGDMVQEGRGQERGFAKKRDVYLDGFYE
jgi:hypothetical protein